MQISNPIGIREVAALLGLHCDTVRDHHERALQPVRVNGQRVYSLDVVLSYAAERAARRARTAASKAER